MTRIQKTKEFHRVLTQKPKFSQEVFERLWQQKLTVAELTDFFGVTDSVVLLAVERFKDKQKLVAARLEKIRQKHIQIKQQKQARLQQKYSGAAVDEHGEPLEWYPGELTPEEIWARAAEIRAGWSEAERARRAGFSPPPAVDIQHFVYDGRTASFANAG